MAQVYFHCSSAQGVFLDPRGADIQDLTDAREHAAQVVGAMIATPCNEDWRHWVLHVSDEGGEELFAVPFASMLGRLQ